MGAGIPGTGMATLFYILSALFMPMREVVRTLEGRSTWARWRVILRHLLLASAMLTAFLATFGFLPVSLLPRDVTLVHVPSLWITAGLLLTYVAMAQTAMRLVPGGLELPPPRLPALEDRPRSPRSTGSHRVSKERPHPRHARLRRRWTARGATGHRDRLSAA